jgi:iron(III) transport system substrate-binding protein
MHWKSTRLAMVFIACADFAGAWWKRSTLRPTSCALATYLVCLVGCVPQQEKRVVLYSASDREYATPILDAFERANAGVEIARQFDVEASKTLGLVTRIEREKERTRCDVFWNNELLHTIRLQKQGLLASRRWKVPDNWPKELRAKDGTWIGFAARARVLLVNKNKLSNPTMRPKSVLELADEKWQHQCALAYPVYGTTATHMAVLASHAQTLRSESARNEPYYDSAKGLDWPKWTKAWIENAVVLAGNKQVALAVSSGELAWGLTDTDDAIVEMESGNPVEIVFPDQGDLSFGTVLIPNTISVLRNAPNPRAAALLADYLVSEKAEARLTMGNSAQFPVWPGAKTQSRLSGSVGAKWANVDFEKAADTWVEVIEDLKRKLDESKKRP